MAFDRTPKIELVEDYEPNSIEVVISGQRITVYEMSLSALEHATRLVEPHLMGILQIFQSEGFVNIAKGEEVEPGALVQEVMTLLREKLLNILADAPVAVLRAIACMMNADPEDEKVLNILRNATPRELMETLEKLNELNDFGRVLTKMTEIVGYLRNRYIPATEEEKEQVTLAMGEE